MVRTRRERGLGVGRMQTQEDLNTQVGLLVSWCSEEMKAVVIAYDRQDNDTLMVKVARLKGDVDRLWTLVDQYKL